MDSKTEDCLGPPPAAYTQLRSQLAQSGWICQGTVVARSLRRRVGGRWVAKGPYYLWTTKRRGKTVCYALSRHQYEVVAQAIKTNRQVLGILAKMQAVTFARILKIVPGVTKRK
jgi:hypothetical protein